MPKYQSVDYIPGLWHVCCLNHPPILRGFAPSPQFFEMSLSGKTRYHQVTLCQKLQSEEFRSGALPHLEFLSEITWSNQWGTIVPVAKTPKRGIDRNRHLVRPGGPNTGRVDDVPVFDSKKKQV